MRDANARNHLNCTFFFSFSIYVKDGYGKELLYSYCGPDEGAFFITSTPNISVEVKAMNKYETFTARYTILNGSIDKGKEFQVTAVDAIMSSGTVHEWTFLGHTAAILNNVVSNSYYGCLGARYLLIFPHNIPK